MSKCLMCFDTGIVSHVVKGDKGEIYEYMLRCTCDRGKHINLPSVLGLNHSDYKAILENNKEVENMRKNIIKQEEMELRE